MLTDLLVSGKHCTVTRDKEGRAVVVDTSTNGTFHNNVKLGKGNSGVLEENDTITIVPSQAGHDEILFVFSSTPLAQVAGTRAADALHALLLSSPPLLSALSAAASRSEAETLARSFVTLHEANPPISASHDSLPSGGERVAALLAWAIEAEVGRTERVAELFRGISVPTKLVSDYAKRVGSAYLIETLQSTILQLLAQGLSLEVDEAKLEKGEDVGGNLQMLLLYCNIVVQMIFESLDNVPPTFPHLFALMKRAVLAKWPEEEHIAVGGFVFLRFFCPALVSPHLYGIVTAPLGPREHRSLMLVAKALQNMANGRMFGSKEPYMIPVNEFIQENIPRAKAFFDAISSPPEGSAWDVSLSISAKDRVRALLATARCLQAVREKLVSSPDVDQEIVTQALDAADSLLDAHQANPLVGSESAGLASVEDSARAVKQNAMQELLSVTNQPGASSTAMSVPPPRPDPAVIRRKRAGKAGPGRLRKASETLPLQTQSASTVMPIEHVVPAVDLNLKPVDFTLLKSLLPEDESLALIEQQYFYLINQTESLQEQLRRVGKEKRRWHHEAIRLRREQGLTSQLPPMNVQTSYDEDETPFNLFLL